MVEEAEGGLEDHRRDDHRAENCVGVAEELGLLVGGRKIEGGGRGRRLLIRRCGP